MADLDFTGTLTDFFGQFSIDAGTRHMLSGSHDVAGSWSTVNVSGLRELERNLNELPEAIAKKVLRKAAIEGSELFRARAELGAPYEPDLHAGRSRPWKTGHLRDLILKSITIRSNSVAGATIRGKIGLNKEHAFYGRFLEKGWTDIGGNWHEPRKFMLTAFEVMKGTVLALFEVQLRAGIEREARKLHPQ
jgi:HK97 gp10 family phage protein